MPEPDTFQDLVRRIRAGENDAAEELVRRYGPTIRRIARVRLADTRLQRLFDSADVCQSVFASFFVRTALGEFDLSTPEQLLNLLLAMAQRKVADRAREARAARRDYRRTREASNPEKWAAPGATPSEEVAMKELVDEFRKRLSGDERLLAEQRAAGRPWAEIAAERGGSAEALRKELSRAIDRVALELGLETFL
jgi:RNA polymerase sigma-70 factor (ECF subfamily)